MSGYLSGQWILEGGGKQRWILLCILWQQTQKSIFDTGALFSGLVVGFKVGVSERALKVFFCELLVFVSISQWADGF